VLRETAFSAVQTIITKRNNNYQTGDHIFRAEASMRRAMADLLNEILPAAKSRLQRVYKGLGLFVSYITGPGYARRGRRGSRCGRKAYGGKKRRERQEGIMPTRRHKSNKKASKRQEGYGSG
jgi:hypothetical protein